MYVCIYNLKIRPVSLCNIRHGPTRSPSWLCVDSIIALQGTVMVLREVSQGGILQVESEGSLHRGRFPPGAMTDCSQSYMTDSS